MSSQINSVITIRMYSLGVQCQNENPLNFFFIYVRVISDCEKRKYFEKLNLPLYRIQYYHFVEQRAICI